VSYFYSNELLNEFTQFREQMLGFMPLFGAQLRALCKGKDFIQKYLKFGTPAVEINTYINRLVKYTLSRREYANGKPVRTS